MGDGVLKLCFKVFEPREGIVLGIVIVSIAEWATHEGASRDVSLSNFIVCALCLWHDWGGLLRLGQALASSASERGESLHKS